MIIFGTTSLTLNPGKGVFHCPQCGPDTPYGHKRVRRFFTLYFIPLIPLDAVGEYLRCDRCGGEFNMEALNFDPSAQSQALEEIFNLATRHTLIATMLCNGQSHENQIGVALGAYHELTGATFPEEQLRREIQELQAEGAQIQDLLEHVASAVNDSGKEALLRAVYQVAVADGEFDQHEQGLLMQIGQALGMSNAHMMGVLAEFTGAPAPALSSAPPPVLGGGNF